MLIFIAALTGALAHADFYPDIRVANSWTRTPPPSSRRSCGGPPDCTRVAIKNHDQCVSVQGKAFCHPDQDVFYAIRYQGKWYTENNLPDGVCGSSGGGNSGGGGIGRNGGGPAPVTGPTQSSGAPDSGGGGSGPPHESYIKYSIGEAPRDNDPAPMRTTTTDWAAAKEKPAPDKADPEKPKAAVAELPPLPAVLPDDFTVPREAAAVPLGQ